MNRFLNSIFEYAKFFFTYLGIIYLFDELWNWFPGDSLLRNAVVLTLAFILVDLARVVCNKLKSKKETKSV